MTNETIELECADGYARLLLNRPESLNSFNVKMHEEVAEALKQVVASEQVRALLVTGAGRGFCAGQDMNDRSVNSGDAPADLGETLATYYNPLIRRLRDLPMPVICAVNGVAAGAGACAPSAVVGPERLFE